MTVPADAGTPSALGSGLRIRDLVGAGKRGLQAFNTKGLELHNIKIDAAEGPTFLIRDSSDLELDRVETDHALAAMPVIRLDRVVRALVQSSRAWPGTGTFLSTAPGLLKSVELDSNHLAAAKTQTEESATDYWQSIDSPDKPLRRQ